MRRTGRAAPLLEMKVKRAQSLRNNFACRDTTTRAAASAAGRSGRAVGEDAVAASRDPFGKYGRFGDGGELGADVVFKCSQYRCQKGCGYRGVLQHRRWCGERLHERCIESCRGRGASPQDLPGRFDGLRYGQMSCRIAVCGGRGGSMRRTNEHRSCKDEE